MKLKYLYVRLDAPVHYLQLLYCCTLNMVFLYAEIYMARILTGLQLQGFKASTTLFNMTDILLLCLCIFAV